MLSNDYIILLRVLFTKLKANFKTKQDTEIPEEIFRLLNQLMSALALEITFSKDKTSSTPTGFNAGELFSEIKPVLDKLPSELGVKPPEFPKGDIRDIRDIDDFASEIFKIFFRLYPLHFNKVIEQTQLDDLIKHLNSVGQEKSINDIKKTIINFYAKYNAVESRIPLPSIIFINYTIDKIANETSSSILKADSQHQYQQDFVSNTHKNSTTNPDTRHLTDPIDLPKISDVDASKSHASAAMQSNSDPLKALDKDPLIDGTHTQATEMKWSPAHFNGYQKRGQDTAESPTPLKLSRRRGSSR